MTDLPEALRFCHHCGRHNALVNLNALADPKQNWPIYSCRHCHRCSVVSPCHRKPVPVAADFHRQSCNICGQTFSLSEAL